MDTLDTRVARLERARRWRWLATGLVASLLIAAGPTSPDTGKPAETIDSLKAKCVSLEAELQAALTREKQLKARIAGLESEIARLRPPAFPNPNAVAGNTEVTVRQAKLLADKYQNRLVTVRGLSFVTVTEKLMEKVPSVRVTPKGKVEVAPDDRQLPWLILSLRNPDGDSMNVLADKKQFGDFAATVEKKASLTATGVIVNLGDTDEEGRPVYGLVCTSINVENR